MPRTAQPRAGKPLVVKKRWPPFSFWPTRKTGGRPGIQTQVFANDPWNLIESTVSRTCPQQRKSSAVGFFSQARDYYNAANSASLSTTKPVLTYYSILNLVKAYILTFGKLDNLDTAKHRIYESNAGVPISRHCVTCYPSGGSNVNIFAEFQALISGMKLNSNANYRTVELFPQIILGHRMWCINQNKKERFIRVAKIEYLYNPDAKEIWLRFFCFTDDLSRIGISRKAVIQDCGLSAAFRNVDLLEKIDGREAICYEENSTTAYTGWPSDELLCLSQKYRNNLWLILGNSEPYRKYYLYTHPSSEKAISQLLSIYILSYYLGSVTRYRPSQFSGLLNSSAGAQIREFVDHQTVQFLYMLASYFEQRDVVKPAVI